MKRLTFLLLFIAATVSTFAQDGHITYTDVSNSKHYGRDVLVRSDATNLDTLTSVYNGSIGFDTATNHVVVFDKSSWQELAYGRVRDTSVTIASAAVLTLNTTPVTLVPAPGAGYAIEVISSSCSLSYVSAAYATNTNLQLITSGATDAQFDNNKILTVTVTAHWKLGELEPTAATDTQLIANAALQAKVETGNPTAGDSNIKIYLRYRIIEL